MERGPNEVLIENECGEGSYNKVLIENECGEGS